MTVHMWNDEQVDVFCGDDSDAPLDFVTRERVDDVTCHACLRAAIEFGERCINRLEHLRDPGCGPDTTFGYRRVVPVAGEVSPLDEYLSGSNMAKMMADAIDKKRGKA